MTITIPKAPNNPYRERKDLRWDPDKPCICPVCHGLGMPWRGWFNCEECTAISQTDTGRVFESAKGTTRYRAAHPSQP